MDYRIVEGNYTEFGTKKVHNTVYFTFEGEKDADCGIVLYHKKNGRALLNAPKEYCIGAVRSLGLVDFPWNEYEYNLWVDGQEIPDPYAKRFSGLEKWADAEKTKSDFMPKSCFAFEEFDWNGDVTVEIPREDMVMYKLHVRGFTKDYSALKNGLYDITKQIEISLDKKEKGTFAGVRKLIPYLKNLGITTVELMPVYEFMEVEKEVLNSKVDFEGWSANAIEGYELMQKAKEKTKEDAKKDAKEEAIENELKEAPLKINYWGYDKGYYFAPKSAYSSSKQSELEFKALVAALHQANMECILEMCFEENCNPNFVVDVLRYWVKEYHVDGFHLLCPNLAIETVVEDIMLRRSKIFYDKLPDYMWNKKYNYPHLFLYRDEFLYIMRKQLARMDANFVDTLNQLQKQHESIGMVNFIASNNGFTLADCCAYTKKHNEANGENNCDGSDWNFSVNYGVEGDTKKKNILLERLRYRKNALSMVCLSQGIPMILAGDEFGNSQGGNNNAYCQDNTIGWVNWKECKKNQDQIEYVRQLLAIRNDYSMLHQANPMQMRDYASKGMPDLSYHNQEAWVMEYSPYSAAIGMLYAGAYASQSKADEVAMNDLYIAINLSMQQTDLALPKITGKNNYRLLLTSGTETDVVVLDGMDKPSVRIEADTIAILEASKS